MKLFVHLDANAWLLIFGSFVPALLLVGWYVYRAHKIEAARAAQRTDRREQR